MAYILVILEMLSGYHETRSRWKKRNRACMWDIWIPHSPIRPVTMITLLGVQQSRTYGRAGPVHTKSMARTAGWHILEHLWRNAFALQEQWPARCALTQHLALCARANSLCNTHMHLFVQTEGSVSIQSWVSDIQVIAVPWGKLHRWSCLTVREKSVYKRNLNL